jgi:putative ABC transport system permease protein
MVGIAAAELRRQPGRFLPVGGALTLLVVLLVVLGGFLDGLELVQTGAIRAQDPGLIVVAGDAERQLTRSTVAGDAAEALRDLVGEASVGRLDQLPTTAAPADDPAALRDVVLVGYDVATDRLPAPPPGGGAVVDRALADVLPFEGGDVLEVGPAATPVEVTAIVDDLTQGAPTIWVAGDAWREVAATGPAVGPIAAGGAQALVVVPADGADRAALIGRIADAGLGVEAITSAEAVLALPVVQQQSSTFQGIIGVTFAVTLLVVALFFALITLERTALYAVLKALGARTRDLLLGVSAQAAVTAVAAVVVGVLLALGLVALLPPDLPVRVLPTRLAAIAAGTVVTAVVGGLLTLRRITAIDPADAIG